MAELLVRNIDKINPNSFELNTQCLKRGDVVVVQEDGWPWSPRELAGNPWTVIKFPGATVSAANSYLTPVYAEGPDDPRVILPRAYYFDLNAALPQTTFIGGDAQMLAYKVEKPVMNNPNVFA